LINSAKTIYSIWTRYHFRSSGGRIKGITRKIWDSSCWTILGLSALPTDHDLNVGMLGMGNYGPNVLTNECDVLIALGMRFDDRVTGNLATYAKQAKVIHFDIDPAEIDKT
jgi:acetolactate synthase-1/2/3 large subunit